jgi:hypothetical protein
MTTPEDGPPTRRAVRFFWSTLIAASVASVAGNIAHAVLAEPGHAAIAATAAVLPPAVLLGATRPLRGRASARALTPTPSSARPSQDQEDRRTTKTTS